MVNLTMLVRNRRRLTLQSLESLVRSGTMQDARITLLDDSSDYELACDLEFWCQSHCAVYIRINESPGTGWARNQVIHASEKSWGRGEYLCISDNDIFAYPSWLPILIKCYRKAWDHGFRVIGAYNHPYHQPVSSLDIWGIYKVKEVHALALQSMLMDWSVWDKYGPFCQTPPGKVCQSEDVDFARKIQADGYKLGVVSPALVVNTGITNSFGEKIPGWEAVLKEAPPGVIVE